MAFLEDVFKGGNIVAGLAIGVGTAVVLPLIMPAVGTMLRPAAKAIIKGGILAYDQGRQAMARVGEAASDVVAEARSDAQHAAATVGADAAEAHPS
jgi:hypothetical protein